jgi:tetratricopeptide (TPR) repeat protein
MDTSTWSAGKFRQQGEQAMASGDYGQAIQFLNKAISMEPDNALNYMKLYRVHQRKKQYAEALDDLTKALAIDPKNADYLKKKLQLLVSLGQCSEAAALAAASSSVDLDAKLTDQARVCAQEIEQAEAAYFQEEYASAADLFQRALLHVDLQGSDLLWMKAQSLYQIQDFYGVISDTGKILKQHSNHLEALRLRGQAYFRLGEHDQAILHFREALKFDPEHKSSKEAHKLVKTIEKKRKKGEAAFEAGNYQEAVDFWWEAIHVDNTHTAFFATTLLRIIQAHSKAGQHKKAIEEAEKLVNWRETYEGLLALGDAQIGAEKYNDALKSYRRAEEVAPGDEAKKECQNKIRE